MKSLSRLIQEQCERLNISSFFDSEATSFAFESSADRTVKHLYNLRGFKIRDEALPLHGSAMFDAMVKAGWGKKYIKPLPTDSVIPYPKVISFFIDAIERDQTLPGIMLSGGFCTGKTTTLALLAKMAVQRFDVAPIYATPTDMSIALPSAREDKLRYFKTAQLLFIDDISHTKSAEYAMDCVTDVVDYRRAHNLYTCFASNIPIALFQDIPFGGRLHARLSDPSFVREFNINPREAAPSYK
jgi:hypothetical protein